MNKIKFILSASILFALLILSCSSNSHDDSDSYNTFKDLRDGQIYKWVEIGNQIWMAENLNYNAAKSKCYDNNSKNCREYGRLYDWETAVDACPDGWHLPSDEEWQELIDFAGGDDIAGKKLRAKNSWSKNDGTDDYGFSALPGGFGYLPNASSNALFFLQAGKYGNWWSITEFSGFSAFERNIDIIRFDYEEKVTRKDSDKNYLQSIRCVKNDNSYNSLYIGDLNSDGGTFTDSRNGQVYKWVEIGSQTWMAENLNYDVEGSSCYNNDLVNCEKYGRLYDWVTARTVCPDGWHLPNDEEWEILTEEVGGKSIAGIKLKTKDGWMRYPVHKGTDNYNFSALPSGSSRYDGYWWSATEEKDYYDAYSNAYYRSMHYNSSSMTHFYTGKSSLHSVRCVKGSSNDFSGTFTDSRDGQVYNYAKIGSQTWMAENLNYDAESSVCYDNKPENCEKYGKLYDWETALNVCPKDWHLPSNEEWITLTKALDGPAVAGAKLKTKNGWNDDGGGTDDYGFSALPGGHGDSEGNFLNVGEYGDWWSSSEYDDNTFAVERHIEYADDKIVGAYTYKSLTLSVRCIKD